MPIDPVLEADIQTGLAVAGTFAAANPNVALALTLAAILNNAVVKALGDGTDITDAQLSAIFAADDAAKADDLLAHQQLDAMPDAG